LLKEIKIMRISSTNAIEGGRVLSTIGRVEAASTWHPAHRSPLHKNWRELVLRELIRKAEDFDADAIIRVEYQNDGAIRIDETRVKLKRVVATGIAVKLSCAAWSTIPNPRAFSEKIVPSHDAASVLSEPVKAAIEARRLGRSLPCDAPDEVIRRLLELADMRENSHTSRHRQGASEEAGGKPMEELNRIVNL
jgi:uncharacterized protein YbjQ (UPF0145 family)